MSSKAFALTAYYDSVLSNFLNKELNIKFPYIKTMHGRLIENLRYGENPHQQGSLYSQEISCNLKKLVDGGRSPSISFELSVVTPLAPTDCQGV